MRVGCLMPVVDVAGRAVCVFWTFTGFCLAVQPAVKRVQVFACGLSISSFSSVFF